MITYDYVYDFINHPYQSEFLDQDSEKCTQSFRIPDGVQSIHGMRVKLSKYGDPGPIHYSIGRQPGEDGIVTGIIQPERVLPVFELMVGDDFQPAPVTTGETLYLTLWADNAHQPLDAYRIYGPNTRKDIISESNSRIPYWWHEVAERLDDVNAPLPTLYAGANYADYAEGCRLRANGTRTWSISFQILTNIDLETAEKVEQQFEFARRLLAPPFAEWQALRDNNQMPDTGELAIDATWGILNSASDSPLLRNALVEIQAFFEIVMGVTFRQSSTAPGIVFQGAEAGQLTKPEEFLVHISADQVLIQATHERGFLRAVYWLEDEMLIRRAPILPLGEYRIVPRYDVRMVPGIYPAPTYFMLREAQIWTPGYMWRLSRAGYNAVYFQASLEDFVENSAIFPELNDPEAPAVLERLRRSVELGAQYGVDFYWDIKTGYERKFPESVYQRLPHIKSFDKFGNFPCTGQELVLTFLRETVSHVFSEIEALKGLIIFYDTEGFYSCITHNSKDKCPYCRDFPIEELSARLFQTLKEAVRVKHRDRELVLFTYICDEDWNYRVIENMPGDVTLAACYSQLKELERCGIKLVTDDYSLCSSEPSDYFLRVKRLANQKGLRFMAKTEDTFGQEFVSTPFTPCLEQHQRRWDSLNRQQVDGFLSQYLHVGFMPTPCQDLMRQNISEIFENGRLRAVTSSEKIATAAVLSFGKAGAPLVVQAWQAFSVAIREYFPYTRGVCRYPGPLQSAPGQPFYLDPAREMPRCWARGYVNDLKWTSIADQFLLDKDKTWDERVVADCFRDMLKYYQQGNQYLEEAIRVSQAADRPLLAAVLSVSRMQSCQMQTMVNLIEFLPLRDEYRQRPAPVVRGSLVRVLESELENACAALVLSSQDSRLGFSGEGDGNVRGGHFNPFTIRQKITELRRDLDSLNAVAQTIRQPG